MSLCVQITPALCHETCDINIGSHRQGLAHNAEEQASPRAYRLHVNEVLWLLVSR